MKGTDGQEERTDIPIHTLITGAEEFHKGVLPGNRHGFT